MIDLWILNENVKNGRLDVKISDPNGEHFQPDPFSFSGAKISKNVKENTFDIYRVKVYEKENLELDSENDCKEYEDIEGFKKCVENVVRSFFLSKVGCLPPWFTETVSDMCSEVLSKTEWMNVSSFLFPYFDSNFVKVRM